MRSKTRIQVVFVLTLALTDVLMAGLAFLLGYWMRRWIPWPDEAREIGALYEYSGIILAHVFSVLVVFAFSRLYRITRQPSRVDEFYAISASATVATLVTELTRSIPASASDSDATRSRTGGRRTPSGE